MGLRFEDQVCVVTGGTQGIGWAMTWALAAQGAIVYACGFSQGSLDKAEAERATLPAASQIHLSRCDVTDQAVYEAWLEEIWVENGRIDLLINNAAFVRWADVLDMTVEEAQRTMRVGYDGMIIGTKFVLPKMQAAGRGHIVNIGSVAGRAFVGGASAAYAATKAAIDAYTQILHAELTHSPVNATIVRLGTVAGTDFFRKHVSNERMPPFTQFLPALTPERVATAVLHAIVKKRQILTLPRYLELLTFVYNLSPRFARWLAQVGGPNCKDYAGVD
ncbi:SDR family NAD(P)-dependent oxidoreductase [Candidatus Leptofilum sp.]|uniref:SDR family NAD(P)-dependent oxidoreductase n=1 Tax=Candidatus Leptofilum sp. TaxID=3241576 RepID=UPI003B5A64E7